VGGLTKNTLEWGIDEKDPKQVSTRDGVPGANFLRPKFPLTNFPTVLMY
jgi:hypothetical protein